MIRDESSPNRNSLEWHILFFIERCEECNWRMTVHTFRPETKKNKMKIVYVHCANPNCEKKGEEVPCTGEILKPAQMKTYEKKRERISAYMRTLRIPVIQIRRQERIAHVSART